MMKPGQNLRDLADKGGPAQVAGVVGAYFAVLAGRSGIPAVYISGGATAAGLGLPDLGVLSAGDVSRLASEICSATDLPLLVDADTGFGNEIAVSRTARMIEGAGAAGMHLEDQVADKRCGHRPGKELCPAGEMAGRIKAACDARRDGTFVVMARTDAIATDGIDSAVERCSAYVEAGADMLFLEGVTEAGQYGRLTAEAGVPVLANITEFGVTPLFTREELAAEGVALALYPLTAFRVMAKAAEESYAELAAEGTQAGFVDRMQTREELYERLGYHRLEGMLDEKAEQKQAE